MRQLWAGLDFWTISQTTALISAVFGLFIVARACWDNTVLPALTDRTLELVCQRAAELRQTAEQPDRSAAALGRRMVRTLTDPRLMLPSPDEAAWVRKQEQRRKARPSPAQRRQSAVALAALLRRPHLVTEQQTLLAEAVTGLSPALGSAADWNELRAAPREHSRAAASLLRRDAARRFVSVFLPAMGRYLDFVGRGSALGLAVGVLASGGFSGDSTLVGVLTTVCGIGGAIVFTATVIRCDARSWPAPRGRVPATLRRIYPEASFLLRLLLTVAAVLVGVSILRQ
ncbi:hypothetical protein ITX31_04950 [Arthrobacter gandavensis]|uniref:hypothetical protein n=1 Tax=Arthrobacter gandavensis TaxID=169960 RepID=UPI00188F5AFA|nr:hypothetical protein [Arthrobacter gandavensis]MBF4993461.1 hypothetical protein [Arthrobacter gandavensis]